jgi:transglutaminase-like putative cysteine protease
MELKINHQTEYLYEQPVHYSIQELRLRPVSQINQEVREWKVKTPSKLNDSKDPFGNRAGIFTLESQYTQMLIEAQGVVVTKKQHLFNDPQDAVSPFYLLQPTALTEASLEMRVQFSHHVQDTISISSLLDLANAIRAEIPYQAGLTTVNTTATQAFALRAGVCQDHTHMMLGICRANGIPARYVSGYFYEKNSPNLASHAWVDVYINAPEGQWVSIDITNGCLSDDRHIRLAIGTDYYSAAPSKGVRSGGGKEKLLVRVRIEEL